MDKLERVKTPAQDAIFRIITGAIKNAADGHPKWAIDSRFASSIAKRAAGTLSAQWPEVLAARPSDSAGDSVVVRQRPPRKDSEGNHRFRGAFVTQGRSPLRSARTRLGDMARKARLSGDEARLSGIVDALRIIAELEKK